jgi:acyl-CoA synthetase (AMP-forming)/AMP-acid ligase II
VGGGRLQQSVAQRARLRLASSIWLLYGSTETGMVAFSHEPDDACPEAVGVVVPNAEVQIVDQAGRTVPHGVVGQVRIRGVCCVEQYLDDPKTSRAYFREGWFYPGDLGTLSETAQLRIVGRADDIMNFGGVKIAPDAIEDLLAACPGVKEAAVFSMQSDLGTDELWLAISTSAHYTERELRQRYRARFPDYPMPHLALIETIPRNSMGKVQSTQLRAMVKAQLSGHATAGLAKTPDAGVALSRS